MTLHQMNPKSGSYVCLLVFMSLRKQEGKNHCWSSGPRQYAEQKVESELVLFTHIVEIKLFRSNAETIRDVYCIRTLSYPVAVIIIKGHQFTYIKKIIVSHILEHKPNPNRS